MAIERDTLRRPPNPPFATAALQQEAFRRLGLGVGETIAIAQHLYEGIDLGSETTGLITYPRTDSTMMAKAAIAQARKAVAERFGKDCVPARPRAFRSQRFRPGARNPQEAHEAIRPTDFRRTPESVARHLDRDAARLYGLVWRRALASQMAAARVDRVRIELTAEDGAVVLAAECTAMAFEGHLRLAPDPAPDPDPGSDPGCARTGERDDALGQEVEQLVVAAERGGPSVAVSLDRIARSGPIALGRGRDARSDARDREQDLHVPREGRGSGLSGVSRLCAASDV